MNAPSPLHLLGALRERLQGTRQDPAPLTREIPASAYIDPERSAQEHQQLFLKKPLIICHESQLPQAGDALVYDWLGLPLITLRQSDGAIATFVNACRHRGMRLLQDEGVSRIRSLVCPYHQWTYGTDGALRNVPRAECFDGLDPGSLGLRAVATEVRHGLVWVQADREAGMDLDGHLAGLGSDLEYFQVGQYHFCQQSLRTVECNWKLIQDAFLDGYHVVRLHKQSVGPFFYDALSESDNVGDHIRSAVARRELEQTLQLPPEQWNPRQHSTYSYTVYPSSVLIMHPDYTSILGLFPQGPHQTIFVHTMLVPEVPDTDKARDHYRRSFELIDQGVFAAEDLFVASGAHRSLRSGATDRLLFCALEEAALRFHQQVERDIQGVPPGSSSGAITGPAARGN